MAAFPESGHSDRQELGEIRVRFRPRLCQNAVFIIMCKSQWQGKPKLGLACRSVVLWDNSHPMGQTVG